MGLCTTATERDTAQISVLPHLMLCVLFHTLHCRAEGRKGGQPVNIDAWTVIQIQMLANCSLLCAPGFPRSPEQASSTRGLPAQYQARGVCYSLFVTFVSQFHALLLLPNVLRTPCRRRTTKKASSPDRQ